MMLKKIKSAFTLIELMVAISIIAILILGVTSMDFNRLSNRQKLEIFTNNIKTDFETIRNNALEGKGIGLNLDVPEKWKIDFSKNNSGAIITSKYDGSLWTIDNSLVFQTGYYISKIRCGEINEVETSYDPLDDGGTGSIEISGINIKLNLLGDFTCDPQKDKILELTINNQSSEKIIKINTLNGLIETK